MDKKQLGAFYTPGHTVQYILKQVNNIHKFNIHSKILEPSGGDGIFISYILSQYKVNSKNIEVWDINENVRETILSYGVNFYCKDSLLAYNSDNGSLFSSGNGLYSHIIGNPPYLNKQSDYIKKNKNKLKDIYHDIGVYDTYAMFMYMGCQLLEKGGCLGFIVSDTFLTLGIHKNLRKFLLNHFSIKEITLCPKNLFEGASVSTCIIIIENTKPDHNTFILNDCRDCNIGIYDGKKSELSQQDTLGNPDFVFDITQNNQFLKYATSQDKMIHYLLGGLGMHTKNNQKYLAIVNYNGTEFAKKKNLNLKININDVNGKDWILYHKQGGNYKYYLPAEYAVKWDSDSFTNYVIPKNALDLKDKKGFVISGVCSSLSARLFTRGAMRESNKAMCFFPKDELQYSCEYFLGLLNSSSYNKIIKALNHTNSIQMRDIAKLPMIHLNNEDKSELIRNVKNILEQMKINLSYDFSKEQKIIDSIVEKYF